jgi:CRP-like cAMP-binding protein
VSQSRRQAARAGWLATTVAYWSVERRFAALLLQLDARYGHPTLAGTRVLDRSFTQETLAAMIGVSRKAVVTTLAALRRQGIVSSRGRRLVLEDVDALRRIADAHTD